MDHPVTTRPILFAAKMAEVIVVDNNSSSSSKWYFSVLWSNKVYVTKTYDGIKSQSIYTNYFEHFSIQLWTDTYLCSKHLSIIVYHAMALF